MTYYYMTKSKGRAGCANSTWRKGEFSSKADIKRKYKGITVKYIMTEEELPENTKEQIKRQARPY